MTLLPSILLALATVLTALPASAQKLWRETTVGMSPAQVQMRVPEAVVISSDQATLNGGELELLRVEQFELLKEKFSASFFFKDKKLAQITLSAKEQMTFPSALRLFESLSEALTVRYGRPIRSSVTDEPFNEASANWQSGKTNISVLVMSVAKEHLVFNVSYQTRLAAEAGKL
jgi:hypothetical protein